MVSSLSSNVGNNPRMINLKRCTAVVFIATIHPDKVVENGKAARASRGQGSDEGIRRTRGGHRRL